MAPRQMRFLRLFAVMVVAAFWMAAMGSPAAAHAYLVDSQPADGQSLDSPPAEIMLRFNEPVDPPADAIRVVNAQGERVDQGDYGPGEDRRQLRVSLAEDLADGAYMVGWRAISADSHPVSGAFIFFVGEAGDDDLDPGALLADPALRPYEVAAQGLQGLLYALMLFAAGGVVFIAFVHDGGAEAARLRSLVAAAAAAAIGVTLLAFLLQTMVASGMGWQALTRMDAMESSARSTYGHAALLRFIGLGLLLVLVRRVTPGWQYPALVAALLALTSFTITGHTAVTEPRWLVVAGHLLHVTAGAVWFGGLVMLAIVMTARRPGRDLDGERAEAAAAGGALVARFSGLAAGTVAALLLGGIALGWAEVRSLTALTTTTYGQTLLGKSGLAAVVLGIAFYNNRWLVPAVQADQGQAWERLTRTVRLEALGLTAVLLVTAVLVTLSPARDAVAPDSPFETTVPVGSYQVQLVIDPARTGSNEFVMTIQDSDGTPADVAEAVVLRVMLPEMDVGPFERQPERIGEGKYRYEGSEISIAGEWEVQVVVHYSEFQRRRGTITVTIP